jgi:hypothetical protein
MSDIVNASVLFLLSIGFMSVVISILMHLIPNSPQLDSFLALSAPVFCFIVTLFGVSSFDLLNFADGLHQYAGEFTGLLKIHEQEYLVSTISDERLSEQLGLSKSAVNDWPYWHDTTTDGLSVYALSSDAKELDVSHAIVNDCIKIMLDPNDHRGDHMTPMPSLKTIQGAKLGLLTQQVTATRQMLDDTKRMLDDLGIQDDHRIIVILDQLHALERDADTYQDDASKLKPIMEQLDEITSSSNAIHEEVDHLYHDIKSAQESSRSMDQLRQGISDLHEQSQAVAG